MPKTPGKPSAWLIGTWRSNRKKTLEGWLWPSKKRKKVQKTIRRIMGKLTFRYTKSKVYSSYEGDKNVEPYRVLWQNETSCFVVYGTGKKEGQLITFETPNLYHIHCFRNIEYFSRVRA
jgi:hypothetical protein